MLQTTWLLFTLLPIAFLRCDAFCPTIRSFVKQTQRCAVKQPRQEFLDSLSLPYELNENNPSRTQLLKKLIESESKPGGSSLANPGGVETFAAVAPGAWKVVYAPHMTIAAGLLKVRLCHKGTLLILRLTLLTICLTCKLFTTCRETSEFNMISERTVP